VSDSKLAPATLRVYLGTLRQILDFAGVEPNPVRDKRVKLPYAEQEAMSPPSDEHVLAVLENTAQERRLLFAFLERCGTRVGETLDGLGETWTWTHRASSLAPKS
jgi:hypothetical protein